MPKFELSYFSSNFNVLICKMHIFMSQGRKFAIFFFLCQGVKSGQYSEILHTTERLENHFTILSI